MSSKLLDGFIAYQFLKILTTPWIETKAYELGVIDSEGNVLKKTRDLRTAKEKASYTMIHRIIWNIKRLLDKLPAGQTRIGSFTAGLWMLKEHTNIVYGCSFDITEEAFVQYIKKNYVLNEGVENFQDDLPYLSKGIYRIKRSKVTGSLGRTKTGDRIVVHDSLPNEGVVAGSFIFLVVNGRTNEPLYVSRDDIEKIS